MRNPLRLLVLTVVCGTWASTGYAQGSSFDVDAEAIYFTHSYTDNFEEDTVALVIKGLWLPYYTGWLVDEKINSQADTLWTELCYWSYSNATSGSQTTDTIQMGVFSQGVYTVQLIISITTSTQNDSCNYTNLRDTLDMAFPVCGVTGIATLPTATASFTLYPNPASNSVTINIPESLIGSTATVSDVTGRVVNTVLLSTVNRQLPTHDLGSGVYFITVGNRTQKLIITK